MDVWLYGDSTTWIEILNVAFTYYELNNYKQTKEYFTKGIELYECGHESNFKT